LRRKAELPAAKDLRAQQATDDGFAATHWSAVRSAAVFLNPRAMARKRRSRRARSALQAAKFKRENR
jgi:hypothetical protein